MILCVKGIFIIKHEEDVAHYHGRNISMLSLVFFITDVIDFTDGAVNSLRRF